MNYANKNIIKITLNSTLDILDISPNLLIPTIVLIINDDKGNKIKFGKINPCPN
jgi:hypothetical protein